MHRPHSRYSASSGRSGHATLHTPSAPPQCAQGSITRAASAPGRVDSIIPTARWFLIVPSYRNLTVRSSWQATDARTGRNDSARPGQVADSPKFNSKWARAASRSTSRATGNSALELFLFLDGAEFSFAQRP
jgi:hypothetical protein